MIVRNILGGVPVVNISPTDGPKFSKAQLQEKVHFVNCHGDTLDHTFSGEGPKDTYSTAMDARKLAGVSVGAVAAFECCYGAELYDPTGLPSMSIANAYLAKRAAGVLASTTIAYGPEDDNANADVLCQVFIEQTLRGASLGRALLEARLAYVRGQSVVDPYDEKTLAQFLLLGDPSLHPFSDAAKPKAKASPLAQAEEHAARLQRRVRLTKAGERLSRESSYTVPARSAAAAAGALRSKGLASATKRFRRLRMFQVHEPKAARMVSSKALKEMPKATRVFVATRRRKPATPGAKERRIFDGLLAYQVNGQLVTLTLVSR
jgi:GNAT superfamily N-acetyltransferase